MRDVVSAMREWQAAGTPYAVATVVEVRGSAPRELGATMAVNAEGEVVGSVSGGCVEGAIYEASQEALRTGQPTLETYSIKDEDAYAVGLTCGGTLDVLVRPVHAAGPAGFAEALGSISAEVPVAVATVVAGPALLGATRVVWPDRAEGSLGRAGLDVAVTDDAHGLLARGMTTRRQYGPNGERHRDDITVFVHVFTPPPRMLVFGAVDFAAAVARLGVFLGYQVTVCDARPVFATQKRFPDAHQVVCEWPHRYLARTPVDARTVVCVLTHDPKFDVPVLEVALRGPAAYVGAMGSRRTHEDRLRRLREAGLTDAELARLSSPIGLEIGAQTPQETAVSIAAEIVQRRWGGSGRPLAGTAGRIHGQAAGHASAEPVGGPVTGVDADRSPGHVAGVLLAAGEGQRLGQPKALVRVNGRTLVERGGRILLEAGCDPVVIVLGAAAHEVTASTDLAGAVTVVNPEWRSGMASSLRAGLAACDGSSAAVVTLVDQPGVTAAVVRRLIDAWRSRRTAAVVAGYHGEPRNPVLLDASVWAEALESAAGDVGAREWLRAHPESVDVLECADAGNALDIDTPHDLEAAIKETTSRQSHDLFGSPSSGLGHG